MWAGKAVMISCSRIEKTPFSVQVLTTALFGKNAADLPGSKLLFRRRLFPDGYHRLNGIPDRLFLVS